jgi:hypothetical protein
VSQQFRLPFDPPQVVRVYAGLYPLGRWHDPCLVVCKSCGYQDHAPTLYAAQHVADAHDRAHHAA